MRPHNEHRILISAPLLSTTVMVSPSAMRLTRYVSPTAATLGDGDGAWSVVTSLRSLHSFRFNQLLFPSLQLYCFWADVVEERDRR